MVLFPRETFYFVHYKNRAKHFYESLTHSKNRAKVCRQMLKNGKGDP